MDGRESIRVVEVPAKLPEKVAAERVHVLRNSIRPASVSKFLGCPTLCLG